MASLWPGNPRDTHTGNQALTRMYWTLKKNWRDMLFLGMVIVRLLTAQWWKLLARRSSDEL